MGAFDRFNLGQEGGQPDESMGNDRESAAPGPGAGAGSAASVPADDTEGPKGRGGRRRTRDGAADSGPAPSGERAKRRLAIACGVISAVAVAAVGVGGAELAAAIQMRGELTEATEPLVTLTRSVRAGETISTSDLAVSDVPSAFAPSDAATSADQVAGRVAVVDMTQGNPVSRGSLSGSETASSLPGAVSAGNVGYMLSFSSSADSASPLLRPGDRVDVMAGTDGADPVVICSDVRVIALDGALASSGSSADYSTVTLDVTEDQASRLFSASQGNSSVHLLVLPAKASAGEGE